MRAPEPEVVEAEGVAPAVSEGMQAWRRRSDRVHRLRRWLPWAGGALVAFTVLWMLVRGIAALIVAADFKSGDVRMLHPHFIGRDEKGRPYSVSATEAVRDAAHPDRVTLVEPVLTLNAGGPQPLSMTARAGALDQTRHSLVLAQGVQVQDGRGYRFDSDRAEIDTESGAIEGRSQVVGTGPLGRITASAYSVSAHGDHIAFSGGVRSHLVLH